MKTNVKILMKLKTNKQSIEEKYRHFKFNCASSFSLFD